MCFYRVNDDVLFVVCIILYIFWQIKTILKNCRTQILLIIRILFLSSDARLHGVTYLTTVWSCDTGYPCFLSTFIKNTGVFFKRIQINRNRDFGTATLLHPRKQHDDVIKWIHFPHYLPFVQGIHRSPVNSPHNGQWRGALMYSLIRAWIYGWINNRKASDLRRHRAHYDVTVLTVGRDCSSMP